MSLAVRDWRANDHHKENDVEAADALPPRGLAAAYIATVHEAKARSCLDDTVQSKSDDGSILVMMSGGVYEVLPGDTIDTALWLPPEDVLICEAPSVYLGRTVMTYDIINTDEGEKVGARRLR